MHSVVAIGVFDGVHLGHQALTDQTAQVAAEFGLLPTALTFNPHPMTVVRGMRVPALVSMQRRSELLRQVGIEQVVVCNFDRARADQHPAQFIESKLFSELHAQHVVIGRGFRFGKGAAGTAEDFREAGLEVHEVGQVTLHHERVSSTRIREAVAAGDIELANHMLTRPHRYQGVVVRGLQRGRELGFPTANLQPTFDEVAPADGIYAGYLLELDGNGLEVARWPAAISVGTNPTFQDVPERVVEAHAITTEDLDLYGLTMAVDFVQHLRPMLAFDSIAALVAAMKEDVAAASSILGL